MVKDTERKYRLVHVVLSWHISLGAVLLEIRAHDRSSSVGHNKLRPTRGHAERTEISWIDAPTNPIHRMRTDQDFLGNYVVGQCNPTHLHGLSWLQIRWNRSHLARSCVSCFCWHPRLDDNDYWRETNADQRGCWLLRKLATFHRRATSLFRDFRIILHYEFSKLEFSKEKTIIQRTRE